MDRNCPTCQWRRSVKVALRKESVDRNRVWLICLMLGIVVALRKESVDRNQGMHYDNYNLHWSLSARRAWIEMKSGLHPLIASLVALRKESVDRNGLGLGYYRDDVSSLSARRAWIEINTTPSSYVVPMSLSARRAWIEILRLITLLKGFSVALRKESVDRNFCVKLLLQLTKVSLSARRAWIEIPDISSKIWYCGSRSPQGERG